MASWSRCRPPSTSFAPARHTQSMAPRPAAKIQLSMQLIAAALEQRRVPGRECDNIERSARHKARRRRPLGLQHPVTAGQRGLVQRCARSKRPRRAPARCARAAPGAVSTRACAAPRRHRSAHWSRCRCRCGPAERESARAGKMPSPRLASVTGHSPTTAPRALIWASSPSLACVACTRHQRASTACVLQQPLNRAAAAPRDAILDLARLLGDVDVDRAASRQLHDGAPAPRA